MVRSYRGMLSNSTIKKILVQNEGPERSIPYLISTIKGVKMKLPILIRADASLQFIKRIRKQ